MKTRILFQVCKACFVVLLFTFAACQDKDYSEPPTPEPEPSNEPSLLNYSTSQDVKLNATYGVQDNLISVFDVYTQHPLAMNANGRYELKSDLTPIASGICVGGKINLTKTIPATASDLYIYSPSLFVPVLMKATIAAGVANFSVVDLSVAPTVADPLTTRTIGDNTIDGYLTSSGVSNTMDINKDTYRPNYIIETKEIAEKYLNRIINAFPNGTAVTNPDYYKDAILYLYEPAELKLAMVHGDATYNNTLSYFFYKGTPAEITTVSRSKMTEIVALPYAKLDKVLNAGDMVQLMYYDEEKGTYVKEFPEGTTIGFVLRSNAFSLKKNGTPYIDTGTDVFYSALALNDDNFQHTIFFDAALATEVEESFYCFGFEDTKYGGDKDCNDVMFHVEVNPADAIEKPEPLPEIDFITYKENRKGVLGFEDNWPWEGDYDLNDVVVSYTSEITYVQKTEDGVPTGPVSVQMLDDNITLVHSGGDITCGFAYKVNVAPSMVQKITIDDADYTLVDDGDGFIIKICESVAHEVQRQKPSAHVYISTPKTFNVKVTFKDDNEIDQEAFYELGAPYNPYIIPSNGHDNVEIHLPYYPPTNKANMSLFGQKNDKSDPDKGIWYVGSEDNPYPFGVHLYGEDAFKVLPIENKRISVTYPKFTDWVKSIFTTNKDWYNHPADN